MIVIDANLLIYAYQEQSPVHLAARRWFESVLRSDTKVGIPMQSILAFVRITTHSSFPGSPSTLPDALDAVDSWFVHETVQILSPGPRHREIFRSLCLVTSATGNLSTDAHIAALAIEHGGVLYTNDADFARFPGLRWQNPLVP